MIGVNQHCSRPAAVALSPHQPQPLFCFLLMTPSLSFSFCPSKWEFRLDTRQLKKGSMRIWACVTDFFLLLFHLATFFVLCLCTCFFEWKQYARVCVCVLVKEEIKPQSRFCILRIFAGLLFFLFTVTVSRFPSFNIPSHPYPHTHKHTRAYKHTHTTHK